MEIRLGSVLLAALLLSGCGWFHRGDQGPAPVPVDEPQPDPTIIEPQVTRREVKTPRIKAKDFELGAYFGALSIQDFGVNPIYGASLAYHVTEDFFLQGNVARSKAGQSSLEEVFPQVSVLSNSGRRFTYYDFDLGYNILPGEIFLGRGRAFNSALYVTVGIGDVKFGNTTTGTTAGGTATAADIDNFALNFGVGGRILVTDWLAAHLDVRDHVFESDLFGVTKNVHNIEATLGLSVFY
jgi:outer membrane beta-barrel protein